MKVARWIPLKSLVFVTAALQLPTSLSGQSLPANLPGPKYSVRLEKSVMVPMRDGVKLSTDLYFPEGTAKKLPVILLRTPYNKKHWRSRDLLFAPTWFFAGQGYIVVVQDVRVSLSRKASTCSLAATLRMVTTGPNGRRSNLGRRERSADTAARTSARSNINRRLYATQT